MALILIVFASLLFAGEVSLQRENIELTEIRWNI